jgi:MoxR-like ATPase
MGKDLVEALKECLPVVESKRGQFQGLARKLKASFAERDEVVDGMLAAALAGEHVLLLGPPGTAKSALARAFCGAFDKAAYFEWLLSKFSAPEELFGPISLEGLKADKYRRVTTGKLPEAHVVFLDEIFKSNSAILNSLLTAINERKFHNNGAPIQIPLRMVVGASNELPEGTELSALYDRFLVRYWVDYIDQAKAFGAMLQAQESTVAPEMTLEDWDCAREEVATVMVGAWVYDTLYQLRAALQAANVQVSDRRWKRCLKLLQATAWLRGADEVESEDLMVLEAVLWTDPAEQSVVSEQLQKLVDGVVGQAKAQADMVARMVAGLGQAPKPSADQSQWQADLVKVSRDGQRGLAKLRDLVGQARSERQKERLTAELQRAELELAPVKELVRASLGL